jgi:hypothetical protein
MLAILLLLLPLLGFIQASVISEEKIASYTQFFRSNYMRIISERAFNQFHEGYSEDIFEILEALKNISNRMVTYFFVELVRSNQYSYYKGDLERNGQLATRREGIGIAFNRFSEIMRNGARNIRNSGGKTVFGKIEKFINLIALILRELNSSSYVVSIVPFEGMSYFEISSGIFVKSLLDLVNLDENYLARFETAYNQLEWLSKKHSGIIPSDAALQIKVHSLIFTCALYSHFLYDTQVLDPENANTRLLSFLMGLRLWSFNPQYLFCFCGYKNNVNGVLKELKIFLSSRILAVCEKGKPPNFEYLIEKRALSTKFDIFRAKVYVKLYHSLQRTKSSIPPK